MEVGNGIGRTGIRHQGEGKVQTVGTRQPNDPGIGMGGKWSTTTNEDRTEETATIGRGGKEPKGTGSVGTGKRCGVIREGENIREADTDGRTEVGETGGEMDVGMGSIGEMGMPLYPGSMEGWDQGTGIGEEASRLLKRGGIRHHLNMFPAALAAVPVVLGVTTVLRHDVPNDHVTTLAVRSDHYRMC